MATYELAISMNNITTRSVKASFFNFLLWMNVKKPWLVLRYCQLAIYNSAISTNHIITRSLKASASFFGNFLQ